MRITLTTTQRPTSFATQAKLFIFSVIGIISKTKVYALKELQPCRAQSTTPIKTIEINYETHAAPLKGWWKRKKGCIILLIAALLMCIKKCLVISTKRPKTNHSELILIDNSQNIINKNHGRQHKLFFRLLRITRCFAWIFVLNNSLGNFLTYIL